MKSLSRLSRPVCFQKSFLKNLQTAPLAKLKMGIPSSIKHFPVL